MTALAVALSLALPQPYWIGQLDLERAWSMAKGDGVVVGLVDTGVDPTAPGLGNAVLPGRQFPDLGAGTADSDGHGTQMAQLIVGVAPRAKILPAKLDGGAADANDAIRWVVDHGATVVNLSAGSGSPGLTVFDDGIEYARRHDVVVIASAGNSPTDPGVVSPADRPGVVAVSAVDSTGTFRADISVQGPAVALAAPGVDMLGRSGTSEAAAVVSGVTALVRSKFPSDSADEVVNRLTTTATDRGAPGRDPRYGYGIVNPVRALSAPEPGHPFWWWLGGGVAVLAAAVGGVLWWRARRRA
jgi:hypothetical protein